MNSAASNSSPAADRASSWRLKSQTLRFDSRPVLMGIVNVTPDSFSDGGCFFDADRAIEQGLQLAAEGAGILDIGGESTRPNAEAITEQEELRRVIEVVEKLSQSTTVPISIDTSKSKVAAEAIAAGAQIINDVTGLEGDPGMLETALSTEAGVCVMHMRGNPRTMQSAEHLQYQNVVTDIFHYLEQRKETLLSAGLDRDRICLDPGIGFAKSHEHNLALLKNVDIYHRLSQPLLVGHSRKGFLAKILGDKTKDRTQATVGVSLALAAKGVQVLRVHDVRAAAEALQGFAAAGGIPGGTDDGREER